VELRLNGAPAPAELRPGAGGRGRFGRERCHGGGHGLRQGGDAMDTWKI